MNKEFEEWYHSLTGFVLRCERAESELVMCKNPKVVDLWLEAAFMAGMQAHQQSQYKPVLVSMEERVALCNSSAGWADTVEQQ